MSSRKLLQAIVSRRLSTTTFRRADEVTPGYDKFWTKQEHFQKDNGLPIHLKGGAFDGALYRFTLGLATLGVTLSIHGYYQLITKK